jgi:hypothetical protein
VKRQEILIWINWMTCWQKGTKVIIIALKLTHFKLIRISNTSKLPWLIKLHWNLLSAKKAFPLLLFRSTAKVKIITFFHYKQWKRKMIKHKKKVLNLKYKANYSIIQPSNRDNIKLTRINKIQVVQKNNQTFNWSKLTPWIQILK